MSLTTAFPFLAYEGDLRSRRLMKNKLGLSLSLLTSEDMARMAFVEVRTRCGHEDEVAPWLPVRKHGEICPTFYDTRMGNFDVRGFPMQACTTCSNTRIGRFGNERCQGHFGFIRMPRRYPLMGTTEATSVGTAASVHSARVSSSSPSSVMGVSSPALAQERLYVINPHLFEELEQLLQAECFFCDRFRAPEFDVQRYIHALILVDAGLMGEALHLLEVVANTHGQESSNRRRRDANEEIINTVDMLRKHVNRILRENGKVTLSDSPQDGDLATHSSSNNSASYENDQQNTVLDIRNSICRQALTELKEYGNVCTHCSGISPRITTMNGHLFFYFNKKNAEYNVSKGLLTQSQLLGWTATNERQNRSRTYFPTAFVREHIKELCQREYPLLQTIFPHMGESTVGMPYICQLAPHLLYKVFFIDKLLVPPLPLRLSSGFQVHHGSIMPDDLTRALSDVLGFVEEIEKYYILKDKYTQLGQTMPDDKEHEHEQNLQNLQAKVTAVYADTMNSFAKKEGLFRMYMMGKRVNQACRSVISPDYMLEPNQILLPRPFARRLSFPEQVSPHSPARIALLQRCVLNGPHVYPGATHLEVRLHSGGVRFVDLDVNEQVRRQHSKKYFAMAQSADLIVYRHILDGDRFVFNRQPTLHKVSMMGYRARVLSGLKTLRFHYVNGKSYNADFDGDEMNIHVPQSIEASAEMECLMDANLNYLVPTSGRPVRGLIQDHIAAGVLLTLRDKFLTRDTFVQFLYSGIAPYLNRSAQQQSRSTAATALMKESADSSRNGNWRSQATLTGLVPVPAILKPGPLWTGKQLISVLVHYVTNVCRDNTSGGNQGICLRGTSLIQPNSFATTNGQGEMVQVPRSAMDDDHVIFLNSELISGVLCKNQLGPTNLSVAHMIHEIYGPHMVGELFGALGRVLTLSLQREGFSMGMDDMCLVDEARRTRALRALDNAPLSLPDDEAIALPAIMDIASKIQKEFVPCRMLRPFPANQLLLMTMSGAKGSNTNAVQMALGLGQQLFDGHRVQRVNSGKTLPSFFIGERRARSFGYAMGRFASGIRPAEYVIHAMAGRDGLIDTAVKTSRSGHLQRCLIKGMESLVVHWDHSVRNANGSVVQFTYGGDGLDPMKASTLQAWEMTKDNTVDLCSKYGLASSEDGAEKRHPRRVACEAEVARDPLPAHMERALREYLQHKASFPLFYKVSQVARWNRQNQTVEKLQERRKENVRYYTEVIREVTALKRIRAYCEAGEPVGLLAAQAVGEPSTQMTLNTFHSAGSTVAHVTEGIPRLRELLIYASVQKPVVIIPVERAQAADEAVLYRILQAAAPARLVDGLACADGVDSPRKGYRYYVERNARGFDLTIAMLFSKAKLAAKQRAQCMSVAEHVDSFVSAIRSFAKQIVNTLDGRQDKASTAGKEGRVVASLQDPAEFVVDPIERAAAAVDSAGEDNDENDDDNGSTIGDGGASEGGLGTGDYLESDNDDSNNSLSVRSLCSRESDDEEVRQKVRRIDKQHAAGEVVSDRTRAWTTTPGTSQEKNIIAAGEALQSRLRAFSPHTHPFKAGVAAAVPDYDTFQTLQSSYRNEKYHVTISPVSAQAAASQQLAKLPGDLFFVNVLVHAPNTVVAVVPEVLDTVLSQQRLPSPLPHFEAVNFTRKADDPSSGELVFQGPNATLRQVLAFLSLFTIGTQGIQIHKARTTDIQDMCGSLGVECAYQALYEELDKLFRRYNVDYHHLSLVADTATHCGLWENFNFTGIVSHSASPLFQMTCASSKRFLHTALTRGLSDDLQSISAAVMVGERPKVGTACVHISQDTRVLKDIVEKSFV